jgi:hypothetical protein
MYPLTEIISAVVIAFCGITVGYIVGKARGRQKAGQLLLHDFSLLNTPESSN